MNTMTPLGLFVIANVAVFAFGLIITGLSYRAYRSSARKTAFRNATLGFLLIPVGGVLAPVYQLGIKADYSISARELLELQIIEGTLTAAGIGFLLLSIYTYNVHTRRVQREPDLQRLDR